jgi:large subunit ribosomal protein L2
LIKSAGCFGVVLQKDKYILVKLPSGQAPFFSKNTRATFGEVNSYRKFIRLYKAGQSRWLGKRPTVRGTAINAVDHPHGGGEGRTSGGRHPVTPWGKPTKGARTRNKNKASSKLIIRSRHAKKKGR